MMPLDVTVEIPPLVAEPSRSDDDPRYEFRVPVTLRPWKVLHAELVLHTGPGLTFWPGEEHFLGVLEVPAEGGWRWGVGEKTRFYWELGGGPDLLLVMASRVPVQLDAGVGSWTALGLRWDMGAFQATAGIRGRARFGFDGISASVAIDGQIHSWDWSPWRASLGAFAGVSL